jgi:tetratricopeptide (TPR) repeat protein
MDKEATKRTSSRSKSRTSPSSASRDRAVTSALSDGAGEPGHRRLPVIRDEAQRRASPGSSETQFRYWLASLVRLSDNAVLKAVRAYNRLFHLAHEDQVEIYLDMARDFGRDGKTEEVLEALRKAVALRPNDGRIRTRVGLLHLKSKAPVAAIQAFEKAKALGYSSFRLHTALAEALAQQDEHERAAREYERAIAIKGDCPKTLHQLGAVLDRLGRFEDAARAFSRASELRPDDISYHQSLGFALESAGRRTEAVKCFKRALELEQRQQSHQAAE